MALKPTIYKFNISLSDLNQDYYDSLHLTVAQHPSETHERMMARVLAYCLNAQESLVFTKGLSDPDLPDIWVRTLDDQLALWIDIGEPAFDRIKKATRISREVKVYSFNSKSDVWWKQNKSKFAMLSASFIQFNTAEITTLAGLVGRTMTCSITITGDSAYIATEAGECEVNWVNLQA
ncbi:MAG: YaeQ family protein [Pseudomonadales bacterium]|nr:YaeQ family protein [Pseudomonadales bacterium]